MEITGKKAIPMKKSLRMFLVENVLRPVIWAIRPYASTMSLGFLMYVRHPGLSAM